MLFSYASVSDEFSVLLQYLEKFHSRLKTHLSTDRFHHTLLASTWTTFSDYTGPDLLNGFAFLLTFFLLILGRAVD